MAMEKVKEVKMTVNIETNKRSVREEFENLFDLKIFLDNFFCALAEQGSDKPDPKYASVEKSRGKVDDKRIPKRFGGAAVAKGFITTDQIVEALKIQVIEELEKKQHRPIGAILLEGGQINVLQIDEVLKSLRTGPAMRPA
jgi:hypothetical protein